MHKSSKGFTLIEVIIALAIVGTVISIAYMLLGFSRTTLRNGNDHYDIQNDIRLASGYLSEEVRFATELKIMSYSDCIAEISSHAEYDYFYIEDGALHQAKYVDSSTYDEKSYAEYISSSDSSFSAADDDTLNITLTATEDSKSYDISTDIKLENLSLNDKSIKVEGTEPYLAIRYKTKAPQSSLTEVTDITITGGNSISTDEGTLDLSVSITPNDATIKTVVWSIDDESIATVSTGGVVTAVSNGTVIVTATATDGSGVYDTHSIIITNQAGSTPTPTPTTTPATLEIDTTNPTAGYKGSSYSYSFSATGGTSPYTYTKTSGSLPSGLSLSSSGVLSGTPTKHGTYIFEVQVSDSGGQTDSNTFTLVVNN